jgi:phage terminase small subunit
MEKREMCYIQVNMPLKKNSLKTWTELTPKQKKFVDILVENWGQISKVKAAEMAGYESKNKYGPVDQASRLTNPDKNPHVCRYLEMRMQKELQIYEKDKLRKFKRFDHLSKKAEDKGDLGVAVNAEFRSGQMADMFVSKSEVKHVGLEGMSRDQLEKRLSELEQKIGESKNIIDVTPKETS